jgi:hypothetical protein
VRHGPWHRDPLRLMGGLVSGIGTPSILWEDWSLGWDPLPLFFFFFVGKCSLPVGVAVCHPRPSPRRGCGLSTPFLGAGAP